MNKRIVKVGEVIGTYDKKEYRSVEIFGREWCYPLSRDKIIQNIWGYEYDGYDRNVDDTIKRLRKKLKDIDQGENSNCLGLRIQGGEDGEIGKNSIELSHHCNIYRRYF